MVAAEEEEYFPRGGTSGKVAKKKNFVFEKKNQNASEPKKKLGKRERNRLKQQKKLSSDNEKDGEDDDEADESFNKYEAANQDVAVAGTRLKNVQPLSYHTLTEGLVTLCSVNTILSRSLKVSLPDRLLATIDFADISAPLKEFNLSKLNKIFKEGDIIACKIKSIKTKTPGSQVRATSDPAEINCDLDQNDVHIGSTFLGAVKSREDHGYIIFSGVSGLNAFLPFDNCPTSPESKNRENKLAVGKLVWCKVVKCTAGECSKNVQVSAKDEDFKELPDSKNVISKKSVLPGMKFSLTVTKHLGRDLEVSIEGVDSLGFVPHTHLRSIACSVNDFKVGTKLKGNVLYKFPISHVPAFSLRVGPTTKEEQVFEIGEVSERAEIVSHDKRGLGVKFERDGKPSYGMISRRRMEGNLNDKKLEDLFPRGNHLKVVVIGYHHIDQLYSCSTENELLTGKFLTMTQLKEMVGKVVTVVIKEIKERGAVVTINNRTAFVPDCQVTDTVGSQPLKKLQVNSKHKGRILRVDPQKNSILVTMRPTLVNHKPLVDFAKVAKGDGYYGSVSFAGNNKINVAFFNGLKTEIFQENLIQDSNKYQVGELVKCYVVKESHKKKPPVLSLVRHVDQMLLSIGQTYKLIVKGTTQSAVDCLLNEKSNVLNVSIPLQHLCDDKNLWQKVKQSLSPGMTIEGHLFCFDSRLNPIFTLRESVKYFFQEGGEKLRSAGCAALKVKSLIPAIVSEEVKDGFYVSVPIPNFNRKVLVSKKVIQRYENAHVEDVVWLSVDSVNLPDQKMNLSYPIFESHEKQLKNWAVSFLRSHLTVTSMFAEYKPGDRVSAVATGVENRCSLADGKQGLIETQDKERIFYEGQQLQLMVLLDDAEKGTLHLAECCDLPATEVAEPSCSKKFATVFVSERFFVVKSLIGSICFCPTIYHPNSSKPDVDLQRISSQKTHQIDICHKDDLLFGMPRKLSLCNQIISKDVQNNGTKLNGKPSRKKKRSRSLSNKPAEYGKKAKLTLFSSQTPNKPANQDSSESSCKKLKKKFARMSSDSNSPVVDSATNSVSTGSLNGSTKKLKKKKCSLDGSNPLLLTSEY